MLRLGHHAVRLGILVLLLLIVRREKEVLGSGLCLLQLRDARALHACRFRRRSDWCWRSDFVVGCRSPWLIAHAQGRGEWRACHHLHQDFFGVLQSLEEGLVCYLEVLVGAVERHSLHFLLCIYKCDEAAS